MLNSTNWWEFCPQFSFHIELARDCFCHVSIILIFRSRELWAETRRSIFHPFFRCDLSFRLSLHLPHSNIADIACSRCGVGRALRVVLNEVLPGRVWFAQCWCGGCVGLRCCYGKLTPRSGTLRIFENFLPEVEYVIKELKVWCVGDVLVYFPDLASKGSGSDQLYRTGRRAAAQHYVCAHFLSDGVAPKISFSNSSVENGVPSKRLFLRIVLIQAQEDGFLSPALKRWFVSVSIRFGPIPASSTCL